VLDRQETGRHLTALGEQFHAAAERAETEKQIVSRKTLHSKSLP
jgi:hypothetical protein